MTTKYTIGLDYGTNSVRTLIVNVANGAEVGTAGVTLGREPNRVLSRWKNQAVKPTNKKKHEV